MRNQTANFSGTTTTRQRNSKMTTAAAVLSCQLGGATTEASNTAQTDPASTLTDLPSSSQNQ
eukprot:466624-Rhodomonas_salina.1